MNTPTMTIRLPREFIEALEADVDAGKYENRSKAAASIIKKHYRRRKPKP
jgi:Arc/MetJ-type ribon-helix-helix transcriptional regulator